MARYRKCPPPCAQGASCRYLIKMLNQVPRMLCPYFLKTITTLTLWSHTNTHPRMEMPILFAREHGDKFHEVVEVHGPCNQSYLMQVKVLKYRQCRVLLDRGWKPFVDDYNLRKGDHLIFALTQTSKFTVYIFDELGTRKRPPSLLNETGCRLGSKTKTIATTKKEDHHQNQSTETASPISPTVVGNVRISAPFTDLKGSQINSKRTHRQQRCVTKSAERNRAQSPSTLSGLAGVEPSDDKTKTYPAKTAVTEAFHGPGERNKRGKVLQEEFEVRSKGEKRCHPPLPHKSFDKLMGWKRPYFTKKLSAISLNYAGRYSQTHLEIPSDFTFKHKGLFKEQMLLEGPTGRVQSVYCRVYGPHRHARIKLKNGWPEFVEENRFTLNTQLLFTHTAEGRFLVQVIARGRVEENLPYLAPPARQLHPERREDDDYDMQCKARINCRDEPSSYFQLPCKSKKTTRREECPVWHSVTKRPAHKYTDAKRTARMEWGLGRS